MSSRWTLPAEGERERALLATAELWGEGLLRFMAANPAYTYLAYIGARQMAPPQVHSIYESGHQFLVAMLERLWASSSHDERPGRAVRAVLGAAEAVIRREIVTGRMQVEGPQR